MGREWEERQNCDQNGDMTRDVDVGRGWGQPAWSLIGKNELLVSTGRQETLAQERGWLGEEEAGTVFWELKIWERKTKGITGGGGERGEMEVRG